MDQHELPIEKIFLTEEEIAEFNALQFSEVIVPEIEKIEEDFISGMLDKFVMNVTALNNYLRCPLEFYFKNLVRFLRQKMKQQSSVQQYIMHWSDLFRKMQK